MNENCLLNNKNIYLYYICNIIMELSTNIYNHLRKNNVFSLNLTNKKIMF